MKFCYIDESGSGDSDVVVVVGIVVDALRMNRTKREYQSRLDALSKLTPKPIAEFHTKDVYGGKNAWKGVDPALRKQAIVDTLTWFVDRGHHIAFSAVDVKKFKSSSDERATYLKDPVHAAAVHVLLSLQKKFKSEKNNKGNTVTIFDKGNQTISVPEFVQSPPQWSDTYYGYVQKKSGDPLDQIVDVPFFVDSRHAPLIQIADLVAFILRRSAEIQDCGSAERYPGEEGVISSWLDSIKGQLILRSTRYVAAKPCTTAKFFRDIAPTSLTQL